jgi:hypothetical protein
MELGIFSPRGERERYLNDKHLGTADDYGYAFGSQDDSLPAPSKRHGVFWDLVSPWLGLPNVRDTTPSRFLGLGADRYDVNWQIDAVARRDRRIQELNGPPRVTLGDLAHEAVEAVKRTKTQVAIKWLQDVLKDGPVPQKEIEARAAKDSITYKPLKAAKAKLRVESVRKGQVWRWQLPFAGKLPPKKSTRKRSES